MRASAIAFLLSALCGAVLTPLVRLLAVRLGVIDHALTSRKVHGRPIPRLGGLAIIGAFYAPLVGLLFTDSSLGHIFFADRRRALGLFIGGLAIALLGAYDDIKGAGAKKKFAVQFGVAGAMYALGFRIDEIANPFGAHVQLGWLGLAVTLLWIAGIINAMNLIDGLDGLAGGVALVAVASSFIVALVNLDPLMILFTAALGGAILGFLFYNFNPASIFMGDTGSMFLGFVLATTAIETHHKASTAVALVVPIVALGFPITDTLLAMMRRAARGAPLFQADREHIHHKLLAMGLTHRQTVLVLYAVALSLGAVALVLTFASGLQGAILLIALCGVAFLMLRRLGYMQYEHAPELLEQRRKNLELRGAIGEVAGRLHRAAQPIDVWDSVQLAAPALGASAVALALEDLPSSAYERLEFSAGFEGPEPGLLRARYSLLGERHGMGVLELGWVDGRESVDRDTEIAIELLCEHVSTAVERIERRRVQAAHRAERMAHVASMRR